MHTGKKPDIYRNKKLALFRGAPYNCRQLQIKTEFNSMKFETLQTIADTIARGEIEKIPALVSEILETETGAHWRRDLTKLARIAETGKPEFTVIAKGNGKLPFLAFSSLPGRGFCPGAGDCLKFCYSFRAWRYPAAFSRQAQNSILMQTETGRAAIVSALDNAGFLPLPHAVGLQRTVTVNRGPSFCSMPTRAESFPRITC
jgi:hypothetical protein